MLTRFAMTILILIATTCSFAGETSAGLSRDEFSLIRSAAETLDILVDKLDSLRTNLRKQLREQVEAAEKAEQEKVSPTPDIKPKPNQDPALEPHYVLYITAEWCQPCQQGKPSLEELKKEGYRIKDWAPGEVADIFLVDFDKVAPNTKKARLRLKEDVTQLPTYVKVGGSPPAEIDRRTGYMTKDQLIKWYFERKSN